MPCRTNMGVENLIQHICNEIDMEVEMGDHVQPLSYFQESIIISSRNATFFNFSGSTLLYTVIKINIH